MRRYFDDERDEEWEEEPEVLKPTRDTELTLTPGGLAGIFFALVLICGLCLGVGYWMGHRALEPSEAAAARPAGQTAAPDEEPLQANGSIAKPSAAEQAAAPPTQQTGDSSQTQGSQTPATPATGDANAATAASQPNATGGGQVNSPPSRPAQPQPQVRPAMPSSPNPPQQAQSFSPPDVRAALPGQLMVQIAAVSHEEDANVLVNALRRRGYAVSAQRDRSDELIHVRVGPFTNRADAERMCRRLLDDGYNAFIQP
jgi:DedD protein